MTPIEQKLVQTISIGKFMAKRFGRTEMLEGVHSVPCDLHQEKKGASFSWNVEKKRWRCYGKCGTGGNIVDLCMKVTGTRDREEAIKILQAEFSVSDFIEMGSLGATTEIKEEDREYRSLYNKITRKAKTVDEFLNMDYAMSFHTNTKDRILYIRRFCLGETVSLASSMSDFDLSDDTEFNEYN